MGGDLVDGDGVGHEFTGNPLRPLGDGGTEEEDLQLGPGGGLLGGLDLTDDGVHVVGETLVEHGVGLVEDKSLHLVIAHCPSGHQVLQSTGSGHHDVHPRLQLAHLRLVAGASVEGGALEGGGEGGDLSPDLHGQLPRRGDDHHSGLSSPGEGGRALKETFHKGDQKGHGLARSCPGPGHEVLHLLDGSDALCLDGEQSLVSLCPQLVGRSLLDQSVRHRLVQRHRPCRRCRRL
mmetsp:Transcript_7206/g.11907  ORF Transcript_7206/g.11907 Transcript_7206/m.11907 type:complete len:234 (+) Transcript_7206:1321-2022(+)